MCHTPHDGHDSGDDDKQLRNVVAAATSSAPRANAHDASEDNTEESEDDDEISESGEAAEDVDAVPGPEQEDKQQPQLVGSVVTSRGVFDISLADEAWSDGVEDEEGSKGDTTNLELASAEQTSHQATGHAEETLEPDRRQPVDPKSIALLRGASRFLLEGQHSRETLVERHRTPRKRLVLETVPQATAWAVGTFALSGITSMCWAMRARGPRVNAPGLKHLA
ncbi:hypothetical protein PI126_g1751 [Phytophthora idaei]|nr:hypothetical protein PI126_g1751 [Phytophthora idaei]